MIGRVASMYRHPVKGFTPERVRTVELVAGGYFPCDRLYAVENGASGFDPAAPAHVSKTRYAVLASIPKVALARTAYDDRTGILSVDASGAEPFVGDLREQRGKDGFAAWLTAFLEPDDQRGPLKVLAAQPYRFTDDPKGYISLVNLESLRDLEARIGQPVDPLRFRANVYVDGWPAWSELALPRGARVRLGAATTEMLELTVRCVATHVSPETGRRDIKLVAALRDLYGHMNFGVYLNVAAGGTLRDSDVVETV